MASSSSREKGKKKRSLCTDETEFNQQPVASKKSKTNDNLLPSSHHKKKKDKTHKKVIQDYETNGKDAERKKVKKHKRAIEDGKTSEQTEERKGKKHKKVVEDSVEMSENENTEERKVLAFGWTAEELTQLITNMSGSLPRSDNSKYTTRMEKLDWEKVKFGSYSAADCKSKWTEVLANFRTFRTLGDIVADVKEWVKNPWLFPSSKKNKHPDMPKKPLTLYFQYYNKKREMMIKKNPNVPITEISKNISKKYRKLSEMKKKKYKELYDKDFAIYKEEMEKFKKEHPDFISNSKPQNEGPEKPHSPISLYIAENLKKQEYADMNGRVAYDTLRKQYNGLSDKKRLKWIKKAVLDEKRYKVELEQYTLENPDFHPKAVKSVLNRAEKLLKDRNDGKPVKPASNGYSLFSRIELKEMKDVPPKSKMAEIAKRWKELGFLEKEKYTKQAQKECQEYKESFAQYLRKLPEEEREEVENEAKLAAKKKTTKPISAKELLPVYYFQKEKFSSYQEKHPDMTSEDIMTKLANKFYRVPESKKEKYVQMADEAKKSASESKRGSKNKDKYFKGEPRKPPPNGYGIFSSQKLSELTGIDPKSRMGELGRLWRSKTPDEKETYNKMAVEAAKKYNKEVEKFLSSLSPSEMEEYQNHKQGMIVLKVKKNNSNNQMKEAAKETESDDNVSYPSNSKKAKKSSDRRKAKESDSSIDSESDSESSDDEFNNMKISSSTSDLDLDITSDDD